VDKGLTGHPSKLPSVRKSGPFVNQRYRRACDRITLGGNLAPVGPVILGDHLIVPSQDSRIYAVSIDEIVAE